MTDVTDQVREISDPEEVHEVDFMDHDTKPTQQLDALRHDMKIGEMVDPLRALLNAPVAPPTEGWDCRRLNTKFMIRALTTAEYNQIQDQATRWTRNKRTGRMERDIDAALLSLVLAAAGSVSPNFNDPQLKAKYGRNVAKDVVSVALLPGEIESLAGAILDLSGFNDDLEEQGKD